MAQPYVGEIRMFAGNFPPAGWQFCEGQLLPISENETLFQLIGTTYGGDGQSTFGLPDLRGRIPIHQGNGFVLAETGGAETVTLTTAQMPSHTHPAAVSANPGTGPSPGNAIWAASTTDALYAPGPATGAAMAAAAVGGLQGGAQPHSNLMPFLCVNFIISLFGIFPSPT